MVTCRLTWIEGCPFGGGWADRWRRACIVAVTSCLVTVSAPQPALAGPGSAPGTPQFYISPTGTSFGALCDCRCHLSSPTSVNWVETSEGNLMINVINRYCGQLYEGDNWQRLQDALNYCAGNAHTSTVFPTWSQPGYPAPRTCGTNEAGSIRCPTDVTPSGSDCSLLYSLLARCAPPEVMSGLRLSYTATCDTLWVTTDVFDRVIIETVRGR